MSRKTVAVVVLMLLAVMAFAADVASGVSFAGGYSLDIQRASLAELQVASQAVDTSLPLAVSAFVDAGYLSLGIGVATELLGHAAETQTVGSTVTTISDATTGTKIFATATLLAEIPIPLGSLTLVPLAGIEGDICVAALDAQGNDIMAGMTQAQRSDLHEGWIKAGAELRFPLAGGISLRPWFLAGYRLPNSSTTSVILNLQHAGFEALFLSMRAQAGVAVGFGS